MIPTIYKKKTGQRIRELMELHRISVKEIKEYLSLGSVQGIYQWLNGTTMPSIDNLYALSSLFRVPLDRLVCGNRRPFAQEREAAARKRMLTYYISLCSIRGTA